LLALQYVSKVMTKNPVVPILENFLFQVANQVLTISGSDLQTTFKLSFRIECKSDLKFSAVVPKDITNYLQKLGEAPLQLEWDPATYAVVLCEMGTEFNPETGYNITGRAKYAGDNPADFPIAPQTNIQLFETSSDLFKEFSDLLNYVSKDDLKPAMTGISFNTLQGRFNMVATNGHTLKVVNCSQLISGCEVGNKQQFILPAKPAAILAGLKFGTAKSPDPQTVIVCGNEAIRDKKDGGNISFLFSLQAFDMELTVRNIDERYPQYWNVIPEKSTTQYTTDKKKFIQVLDKAVLFANKTTHQVRLSLNGCNKVSAEDLDFSNEYNAEVGGKYEGLPIEIGFNANFLKEVVSSFGDTFTLEMNEPNKAAVIRDGNSLALVMPVMLNQYV
jgi:DNA polymerase III subunit beta